MENLSRNKKKKDVVAKYSLSPHRTQLMENLNRNKKKTSSQNILSPHQTQLMENLSRNKKKEIITIFSKSTPNTAHGESKPQ